MTALTQYKVALWPSTLAVAPIAEIDTIAENAIQAALSAMKTNGANYMGVVVVMSSEKQETFWNANRHTGNNALAYSRTMTAPRFSETPFEWHMHEKSHEEIEEEIAEMNREQDELW